MSWTLIHRGADVVLTLGPADMRLDDLERVEQMCDKEVVPLPIAALIPREVVKPLPDGAPKLDWLDELDLFPKLTKGRGLQRLSFPNTATRRDPKHPPVIGVPSAQEENSRFWIHEDHASGGPIDAGGAAGRSAVGRIAGSLGHRPLAEKCW